MSRCHGCRTIENLRNLVGLKEEELEEGTKEFEGRIADLAAEAKRSNGPGQIISLPGARDLLAQVREEVRPQAECCAKLQCIHFQINAGRDNDPERRAGWAIVTSGELALFTLRRATLTKRRLYPFAATKAYATKGFAASEVASAAPEVFVTADIVTKGKPDPEPYLKGAELTSSDITKCVVFEDAPPGVLSGKRAGAKVVGLRTTHEGLKQWQNGADFVVKDLRKVSARWEGKGKAAKLFLTIDTEPKPEHIGTNGSAAH